MGTPTSQNSTKTCNSAVFPIVFRNDLCADVLCSEPSFWCECIDTIGLTKWPRYNSQINDRIEPWLVQSLGRKRFFSLVSQKKMAELCFSPPEVLQTQQRRLPRGDSIGSQLIVHSFCGGGLRVLSICFKSETTSRAGRLANFCRGQGGVHEICRHFQGRWLINAS